MATLPVLVLDKVFSFLSSQDLVSARNVCISWRAVVDEPHVWRKSKFVCDNSLSDEDLERYLSEMPFLETLVVDRKSDDREVLSSTVGLSQKVLLDTDVADRKYDTHEILSIVCKSNKALFALIVKHIFEMSPQLLEILAQCCSHLEILHFPELKYLGLKSLPFVSFDGRHHHCKNPPSNIFAEFKTLKKLDVSNLEFFCGLSLRNLIDKCVHLEELFICGSKDIGDNDLLYVIEKKKQSLLSLSVCGKHLSNDSLRALGAFEKLKFLKIRCCPNMNESTAQNIGKLNLETLALTESRDLEWTAANAIFYRSNMPNLKHLDLSYLITLQDDTALLISSWCPELEHLNIAMCEMTEISLSFITVGCTKLKYLNICGLYFSNSGNSLMLIPRLKYLQILEVHRQRRIRNTLSKVQRLLPQLTVKFTKRDLPESLQD